jgi:hypothetical protein
MTENDGYNPWRNKEAKELEKLLRDYFQELQFPRDCGDRKKLTCHSETTDCGWGEYGWI